MSFLGDEPFSDCPNCGEPRRFMPAGYLVAKLIHSLSGNSLCCSAIADGLAIAVRGETPASVEKPALYFGVNP